MISDEQIHLVDKLKNLLEKQIELVRHGNIDEAGVLSGQAGSVFMEITQTGVLELAELEERREQLRQLHKSLCLTIAAQKAGIAEKLSHVRTSKKALKAYWDNA
jgi:hypothetical protein